MTPPRPPKQRHWLDVFEFFWGGREGRPKFLKKFMKVFFTIKSILMRLCLEREVWGLNLARVISDTVLPTARHRRNISSNEAVLPAGAIMTRRWARKLVANFGVIQGVRWKIWSKISNSMIQTNELGVIEWRDVFVSIFSYFIFDQRVSSILHIFYKLLAELLRNLKTEISVTLLTLLKKKQKRKIFNKAHTSASCNLVIFGYR